MIELKYGSLFFHLKPGKQIFVGIGDLSVEGRTQSRKDFSISLPIDHLEIQKPNNDVKRTIEHGRDDTLGFNWRLEFTLPDDLTSVRWKISLTNDSNEPVFIEKIVLLDQSKHVGQTLLLDQQVNTENLSFFANGWQSWSTTGAYKANERMRTTRLGFLHEPMIYNPGTPISRTYGRFSSDFFSVIVDRRTRSGLLLGFLSQWEHFGSITADFRGKPILRMWANANGARLDPGQTINTDWAVIYPLDLTSDDVFKDYLEDVAAEHQVINIRQPLEGWCSWYHYYQNISQNLIEKNLERIQEFNDSLPFNLVQIDDGFQSEVGDWLEFNDRFPDGVQPLAGRIKDSGFTPGLWLAPFILHPRAKKVHDHPEWLLRHRNGSLVRPGFVWNSLGAALDLTHPGALDYVREVIDTAVHQWGFSYLKLDFLYAAALKGKYLDESKTQAQVLRMGMETIREAAGEETLLVGCGAPMGSMLGLVDVMRIGPDVNASWNPTFAGISLPFKKEPSMPSTRNSIQNIITRSMLHNRWWVNDPDCLLLRADSKLTLPEIQSLATAIAMTGGPLVVSDDMAQLPPERLRILAAMLPVMNKRPRVMDLFDSQNPSRLRLDMEGAVGKWHLLACFNWKDNDSDTALVLDEFDLTEGDYYFRSFWDDRVWQTDGNRTIFSGMILSHGVLLLAARKIEKSPAAYLGSDLHISQGLEITSWNVEDQELEFAVNPGKKLSGKVDIFLKFDPNQIQVNDKSSDIDFLGSGHYRIAIPDTKISKVKVKY